MTHSAGHHRRTRRTTTLLTGGAAAAALVAGGGFLLAGNATAGEEAAAPSEAAGTPFAPYVDTSLQPSYDLLESAEKTGVKEYNLAFVTSGGGQCTPQWGGSQELEDNPVAAQISDLRAKGGDVRVSFGGANGSELATACDSPDALAAAYGKVVDTFDLKKIDLDIEGAALPDTEANERRAKAVAALQKSHEGLDVSYTLPVMPEGLTEPGVALLKNAEENGVKVSAVNIMAMDYGPSYDGDMGEYATQAATATHKQVAEALGLGEAEAWKALAITPMIGVNDVNVEVFQPEDAKEVRAFAQEKGMGWVSMWSGTRDKPCPGGPKDQADPTCSSVEQQPYDFTEAFAG
ncbi:chitinase [Streptomyces tubbatahanensis]|uniref:Chitinase n=1 Tax=Streptomyces tubbatahanensis TaxID=2923272 RepID=A0ABY3XRX0_9ACTN|nr:chitinase [Streptomyces tubbatahanensis]UNS97167.1 chitinase [Streptomyces tubbatahanensis]